MPLLKYQKLSATESARKVVEHYYYLQKTMAFKRIVIFGDAGGVGGPILDILRDTYQLPNVVDVHFGGTPDNKQEYAMKRDEMWGRMRDWCDKGGGCLPKDDELKDDMTMPEYFIDDKGRYRLERKDDMKKRGLQSPDNADAFALTFAEDVNDMMLEKEDDLTQTYAINDYEY